MGGGAEPAETILALAVGLDTCSGAHLSGFLVTHSCEESGLWLVSCVNFSMRRKDEVQRLENVKVMVAGGCVCVCEEDLSQMPKQLSAMETGYMFVFPACIAASARERDFC